MTAPAVGAAWPGVRTLTTQPVVKSFDLDECVGQRQATYRFELTDGVTGMRLGDIHPIRAASLTHDTSRTIKRQLGLGLTATDTAAINTLTERISPFMVVPGATNPDHVSGDWPLGRYMFVDESLQMYTSGDLGSEQLFDEMFLVDQEITRGLNVRGLSVAQAVIVTLDGLPVELDAEPSPYTTAEAWGIGAHRGQILEALSLSGDYWSPWFDNVGRLRFRRTFDPAASVPDLDFDLWPRVFADPPPSKGNDLLNAPNTFVVISNASASPDSGPVVGLAEVATTAPNSVANRGFVIAQVLDVQLSDATQAAAVAQGVAQRRQIFERVTLSTPPDPRHDSYNVIRWQGANWLELAWSLNLEQGSPMVHVMRKSYGQE